MTVVRKRVGEKDSTAGAGRGNPRGGNWGHWGKDMFEVGGLRGSEARGVAGGDRRPRREPCFFPVWRRSLRG